MVGLGPKKVSTLVRITANILLKCLAVLNLKSNVLFVDNFLREIAKNLFGRQFILGLVTANFCEYHKFFFLFYIKKRAFVKRTFKHNLCLSILSGLLTNKFLETRPDRDTSFIM
jgi:hypothetical protein